MDKTLSTILTVFKVAKIIAKVVFILCLVGAGGCLFALCMLPLVGNLISTDWLIEEGFTSIPAACLACLVGAISCAGEGVFAFLAERYFGNVLNQGTPFTKDSSDESFRLGIASIIISVAISVASGIIFGIFALVSENVSDFDFDVSVTISTGLFFLFMSLIFKHGAELQASKTEGEPEVEIPEIAPEDSAESNTESSLDND